jgi:hypothetical protein
LLSGLGKSGWKTARIQAKILFCKVFHSLDVVVGAIIILSVNFFIGLAKICKADLRVFTDFFLKLKKEFEKNYLFFRRQPQIGCGTV